MGGELHKTTIHIIRCDPEPFRLVKTGVKPYEIRRNDRDYRVGDYLVIKEIDMRTGDHTGDITAQCITHVFPGGHYGIEEGYVVLTIEPVPFTA